MTGSDPREKRVTESLTGSGPREKQVPEESLTNVIKRSKQSKQGQAETAQTAQATIFTTDSKEKEDGPSVVRRKEAASGSSVTPECVRWRFTRNTDATDR